MTIELNKNEQNDDDTFALNAQDYPSCNPELGDIVNVAGVLYAWKGSWVTINP